MIDFSAPSFSLGLDFDIADHPTDDEYDGDEQEEKEEPTTKPPPTTTSKPPSAGESPSFELFQDNELDFEEETPDLEPVQDPPPPALKRLRRGPLSPRPLRPSCPSSAAYCSPSAGVGAGNKDTATPFDHADDDIEEFSSPEKGHRSRDKCSSVQSHITCSSSKFSLQNHEVLASHSMTKLKAPTATPASNASSSSAILQESSNKKLLPKLTISPIRRIHLLDSDSDEPFGKDENKYGSEADPDKNRQPTSMIRKEQKKSIKEPQKESLWKDFSPMKNMNLATPVLDKFCEDYFCLVKNLGLKGEQLKGEHSCFSSSKVLDADESVDDFQCYFQQQSIIKKIEHNWNLPNPQPPAYQYFNHNDARVRTLVNERLCHFVPLGIGINRGEKHRGAENINYMGQFGTRDVPGQARKTCQQGLEGSSRKKKKAGTSGSWISPKSSAASPMDAGKRRVRADGHRSGHWFTAEDGRKVYVTKNGQELTGQMAYRQYRRESGVGFRRSKKKAAAKKKR